MCYSMHLLSHIATQLRYSSYTADHSKVTWLNMVFELVQLKIWMHIISKKIE